MRQLLALFKGRTGSGYLDWHRAAAGISHAHCALADTLRRWILPGWYWFTLSGRRFAHQDHRGAQLPGCMQAPSPASIIRLLPSDQQGLLALSTQAQGRPSPQRRAARLPIVDGRVRSRRGAAMLVLRGGGRDTDRLANPPQPGRFNKWNTLKQPLAKMARVPHDHVQNGHLFVAAKYCAPSVRRAAFLAHGLPPNTAPATQAIRIPWVKSLCQLSQKVNDQSGNGAT